MAGFFADLKGWFSHLANGLSVLATAWRKTGEWIIHHIYVVVVPVLMALKSSYDFVCTLFSRLRDKLATVDIEAVADGATATSQSVFDVLAFINVFVPVDELFAWLIFLFHFWGVCLFIRMVKGIKQTVAF